MSGKVCPSASLCPPTKVKHEVATNKRVNDIKVSVKRGNKNHGRKFG